MKLGFDSVIQMKTWLALVVKVFAVHSTTAPRWFLPVAGGVLFALFIGAVLTSAVWYSVQYGFPTGHEF